MKRLETRRNNLKFEINGKSMKLIDASLICGDILVKHIPARCFFQIIPQKVSMPTFIA